MIRLKATVLAAPTLAIALLGCEKTEAMPPEDPHAPASAKPNRLLQESSPYLRLHAYNPVDWYPWGSEAIERARAENKPIFLSVGYSTCYWCHVMEREVFSDPAIAELMNRWFVNIKVDREERPDLDEIYMTATQVMTRHGGWPNSVFLTPDLEPFYAGTYFPPEDSRGRPGFPRVLTSLEEVWRTRRAEVDERAEEIAETIRRVLAGSPQGEAGVPAAAVAERAAEALAKRYDESHGGFGGAPKFPSPSNLFLLWQRAEAGDVKAREMVIETLLAMGRGAIYDQLDGGFHRYTLDAAWRTPHFEKMLYDNAHLAELLAVGAAATGNPDLERLARGTLDFVLTFLTLPNGAFKSAIDAETDAVEGAYYIWTREELAKVLGEEGFALLAPIFSFDGKPTFEEDHYALFLEEPLASHAARLELDRERLLARLEPELEKLRRARSKRPMPLVDDKVLTDWNGMMVAAMARAGALLGEPRYTAAAERAAHFLLTLRDGDGTLLHAWREGEARIPAFLDDYAFFIRGLLALDEVTPDERWLREARRLSDELESRLRDPAGGYFMSASGSDLLVQAKTASDGAIPSGNGIAALGLLRLAERTGEVSYRRRAAALLASFADDLERQPQSMPTVAQAVVFYRASEMGSEAAAAGRAKEGGDVRELALKVLSASARTSGPTAADGWRRLVVELDLRAGWHVNANPASLDYLIPTSVEGPVRDLAYPRGEVFRFDFAPEELRVYGGGAIIEGEAAPDSKQVNLTYQACDDRRCLPPVTRAIEIEAVSAAIDHAR